jgi:hypothetical protein
VAVSADGARAVSGGDDGTVRVWNLATGVEQTLTGHGGPVRAAAVSADGARAVSGGDDGTVRVWNLATGVEQRQITGHRGPVHAVAVSADGARAVSGGDDGTVRVWNLATGVEQRQVTGHGGPVHAVAVSADGGDAAFGYNNSMGVYDLESEASGKPAEHNGPVYAVAVNAFGTWAVSGGDDGTVRVWDLARLLRKRIGVGIAHLIAFPFYIALLAWPLALIRRDYTSTLVIDCSNFMEAIRAVGCRPQTIKIDRASIWTGAYVGKGTLTVPHSGISTTGIVVEVIWVLLALTLIIVVRRARSKTRKLPFAERLKSVRTESTTAERQRDQVQAQAAVFVIVLFVGGVVGLVTGYVRNCAPLLLISLACSAVMAGNGLVGKRDRLLKSIHLALGAAAIGWALVDIAVFHSPRYALAAAVLGAWVVFDWKVNMYGHWRQWSLSYVRLTTVGALLTGLSGAFSWQLQAALIAATGALSVGAAISISIDQRRGRSKAADAAR